MVSKKQIDEAKQAALIAKQAWLLPSYVKSANAELCWSGRILRAMDLANEALIEGDTEKVEKIKGAIPQVEQGMDAAREKAVAAEMTYEKLCTSANVQPEQIDVGQCKCAYCNRAEAQNGLFMAESRLRRAVFNLTEPDDCGMPAPLCLMSQETDEGQKEAWALFVELCNSQASYLAACKQSNRRPEWGYILRAW